MSLLRIAIVFLVCLLSITSLESAITINNPGTGSGTIKLWSNTPPNALLLEQCSVGSTASCQVGVSQDTVNGNVIEAIASSGSFFAGWGGAAGNVGACSDTNRTCNITGSSAGAGHGVNATFTACAVNINPNNHSLGWEGGAGNITVTSNNTLCNWTATSNVNWIALSGALNGPGSGVLRYTVSPNRTTAGRNGTIDIGGNLFQVTQEPYLPNILISPDPINFGTVRTGQSHERKITIENLSASNSLLINSVQVTGQGANNDFALAHSCQTISPRGSCLVRLAYKPTTAGIVNAQFVVTSDDPFLPTYEVNITGGANASAAANIAVSPNSFNLSPIDIEFGHVRNVTISNNGTGSLFINDVRLAGRSGSEFLLDNNCPIILPGENCDITFRGYYSSNTQKDASLVIHSSAQNRPVVEIPITVWSSNCMNGAISLQERSKTVGYDATSYSTTVTRSGEAGCLWLPLYSATWLGANLSGTTFSFTTQANSSNLLRRVNIRLGDEIFTVIQHKDQNNTTFDDISGNYFADYINAIYAERITVGCVQDRSYCPLDPVTRGQMAAFIIRALQGEAIIYTTTPYYTDVPSSHWAFKYVQKMRDLGITVVTGTYRVDDYVTRGEMAAFIVRAIFGEDFTYTQTPYFNDVSQNHIFFKYVQKMKDTGITAVTGIYRVDDNVTRQEMAAFLGRAFLGMR